MHRQKNFQPISFTQNHSISKLSKKNRKQILKVSPPLHIYLKTVTSFCADIHYFSFLNFPFLAIKRRDIEDLYK